jgi:PAS domain-containing protein
VGVGPDLAVVRVIAHGRVAAATAAAIALSLAPDGLGHRAGLLVVAGLVWLPWSALVALHAFGPRAQAAAVAGAVGDCVALSAGVAVAPTMSAPLLTGLGVAVLLGAYVGGRGVGAALSAAAVLTTGALAHGAGPLDPGRFLSFALALPVLVALVGRAGAERARAAARTLAAAGRAEAILATVTEGLVVTDRAGRVVAWNPAAERLVAPVRFESGAPCAAVLGLRAGERALDCTRGCPLLGGPHEAELWRPRPDGGRQPLLVSVAVVAGDGGEVVHSLRDISRLKEADEAKTIFLATASHELKTPLTVIRGFAEAIAHRPPAERGGPARRAGGDPPPGR